MMDIQTLRKMRNADFNKITSALEKTNEGGGGSYKDDRFWKLEVDKAGNGSAVIRFLPRTEGDELPWVRIFNHAFQGPTGKWYIENSLTTIEEADPVSELNSKLWNSGVESNKNIARKQKRKLQYICNILVMSDPKNPENEGKVFLYKFGKKIFDMIMDKAKPTFEDESPVNVFDLWDGANFKLRQCKNDGYPNYDKSSFAEPSALFDGDEEKLLEVVGQQHKLSEFLDRKNFKSYDELKRKLNMVLDAEGTPAPTAESMVDDDAPPFDVDEEVKPAKAPKAKAKEVVEDDDDDMMSYFQKIANSD